MTNIIDKNSLFRGTNFAPKLQDAIYKDILYMRNFFPDIFPYQYKYPDHVAVLLQGTVPIRINNSDCTLPLSMAIPINFPNAPPRAQIPVQPNFPLIASNCLQPNGLILTQYFYQWMPMQSRLSHFVNAIVLYFSSHPPFTLEDGRRLVPQKLQLNQNSSDPQSAIRNQATVEAISLLESINSKINECENQYCEDQLTIDMANTIEVFYNDMQNIIEKNQKKLDALESQQLPDVPIDPELENQVKLNSKNAVFETTKSELQNWFENGIIGLDDFLQSIRDLSRDHFQNDIIPNLS